MTTKIFLFEWRQELHAFEWTLFTRHCVTTKQKMAQCCHIILKRIKMPWSLFIHGLVSLWKYFFLWGLTQNIYHFIRVLDIKFQGCGIVFFILYGTYELSETRFSQNVRFTIEAMNSIRHFEFYDHSRTAYIWYLCFCHQSIFLTCYPSL